MNKSFFSGHDLMLSMFESFFKSNKCFIEVPYELNGTNSNNMFHILNQSLGGNIYSYHKELVRFAFELIQDKSDLKGLKDCEIIMFHNVKDFGLILNNLTFDDVKNYFEKMTNANKSKKRLFKVIISTLVQLAVLFVIFSCKKICVYLIWKCKTAL